MPKTKKKSFVLYEDMWDMFELLSGEERGILISAIFNYVRHGAEGLELSPLLRMAFTAIKNTLDRDREAYEEKCAKNRENAKKGGRPKSSEKTERLPNDFSYPYNDSDNDNDNENEIDNDSDSGSGTGSENDSESEGEGFSVSDASAPPPTAPAPRLTKEERNDLVWVERLPPSYIAEREARAAEYAGKHGGSTFEVLLKWHREDRPNAKHTIFDPLGGEKYDELFFEKVDNMWKGG